MLVRIYPRVRLMLNPTNDKTWGDFEEIDILTLYQHLKNYFPKLKMICGNSEIETNVDKWFYERYMICYDHTIFKDGKWRNGVKKLV